VTRASYFDKKTALLHIRMLAGGLLKMFFLQLFLLLKSRGLALLDNKQKNSRHCSTGVFVVF
jgi:hypothetical protein